MQLCENCGAAVGVMTGPYETRYRALDGSVRDLVVPNITRLHCDQCGEELLDHEAMRSIEAAQRAALGRLQPTELRSWRLSLRRTQTELSELLGFGRKTFARWESGAYTINAAADRYIRVLMANPENLGLLEAIVSGSEPLNLSAAEECPSTDVLESIDFEFDSEFRALFGSSDDPAVRVSEVFSLDLTEGRVFG